MLVLHIMVCRGEIDIVDISPLLDNSANETGLCRAFERTGFALVLGHSIPTETIENLRKDAYRFFGSDEKYDYDRGKGYGFGGFVRFAESGAQLLGDFTKPKDNVESLTVKGLNEHRQCDADYPDWMRIDEFQRAALSLSPAFARAVTLCLGVSQEELQPIVQTRPEIVGVRLAHYPVVEDLEPEQMRYGAHVDSGTFTVLSLDPDNPRGLEVKVGERWVPVPYVPGALVINVGALLSRWTGNKWLASVHRVVSADSSRSRVSVVTSALSAKLDGPPLATFSPFAHNSTHGPVAAKDFLAVRVALHRPEFAKEAGIETPADFQRESQRIASFQY